MPRSNIYTKEFVLQLLRSLRNDCINHPFESEIMVARMDAMAVAYETAIEFVEKMGEE